MRDLELLAPARNMEIGIAAIDCGADAVYIAGPSFGARQAAGNSMEDIGQLCSYAHRYGARIYMTLNTILFDDELEEAYRLMCVAEDAGVDAMIAQDTAVMRMADGGPYGNGRKIRIPLHASTQCAIRDIDKALFYRNLGFSRLVLERELPLARVREISEAAGCEIEFFVHGALCVCYSGQCYMSENITGRSANRGECIQACRSLYNLVESSSGKVLARNAALLSLKDYNLIDRLEDLADAGVTSFKIEGRLKNISYVRNTTRAYSQALDRLVSEHPELYRRASYGKVTGGFTPDLNKTFNRGYTELFLDGKRGRWASLDAPKGMGERIGRVKSIRPAGKDGMEITLAPDKDCRNIGIPTLSNGDGFAFTAADGEITGFRGDVCSGAKILCRKVPGLTAGALLFRNISAAFEKTLLSGQCRRMFPTGLGISISGSMTTGYILRVTGCTDDGRTAGMTVPAGTEAAENVERMKSIMAGQLCKSSGMYSFHMDGEVSIGTEDGKMPFVSAAFLNNLRRTLADMLDRAPVKSRSLLNLREDGSGSRTAAAGRSGTFPPAHGTYKFNAANHLAKETYLSYGCSVDDAYEMTHVSGAELMRTKYCIRYELGLCLKRQHDGSSPEALNLENNGRTFRLGFDCANCEMTVSEGDNVPDAPTASGKRM